MSAPERPPPTQPISQTAWFAAFVGRWVVLVLLAGHLLLRQTFAHLSITSLFQIASEHGLPTEASPRPAWIPSLFDQAYLTEVCLVLLLPLAFYVWKNRAAQTTDAAPGQQEAARRLGLPFLLVVSYLMWGAVHAIKAVLLHSAPFSEIPPGFTVHSQPDWYLIFRQSAVAAYALFFLYTFIFFRDRWRFVTGAIATAVVVAVACAGLDVKGLLGEPTILGTRFGQETLALAMLAMIVIIAHFNNLIIRGAALVILAFVGWRQSFRFQSGVPISIAGAMLLYALVGLLTLTRGQLRGQSRTLKRAAACLVLLCFMAIGYSIVRRSTSPEVASKVSSWSPQIYRNLIDVYKQTDAPADPKDFVPSRRPPYGPVSDPEVYKLEAVYKATPSVNAADVVWRMFVWRKKASDWFHGHPIVGAGVGQPWFYEALYHTSFHYGEEREGLDPHNSFLNLLYRYGLIGFGLLLLAVFSVVMLSLRALRTRIQGDVLLEGLLVYFFFAAVFAFFNNAFEGPSYSLPFWISFGLVYARAWQVTHMSLPEQSVT
jgi:hypothetical protein